MYIQNPHGPNFDPIAFKEILIQHVMYMSIFCYYLHAIVYIPDIDI